MDVKKAFNSMTVQEARSKILDSSDSDDSEFLITSCSGISTGSRLSAAECRLV